MGGWGLPWLVNCFLQPNGPAQVVTPIFGLPGSATFHLLLIELGPHFQRELLFDGHRQEGVIIHVGAKPLQLPTNSLYTFRKRPERLGAGGRFGEVEKLAPQPIGSLGVVPKPPLE